MLKGKVGFERFVVGGWVEFGFEAWVGREVFVGGWGVGTGIGIFVDELLWDAKCLCGCGWREKTTTERISCDHCIQRYEKTHAMFESIQIVPFFAFGWVGWESGVQRSFGVVIVVEVARFAGDIARVGQGEKSRQAEVHSQTRTPNLT
jgi:hypothetical protein